ncbi:MAG: class I SAM-dependent methyltransferase [Candidatus Omnitrophota bacterium]
MYLTTIYKDIGIETFDWENYFSSESSLDIMNRIDPANVLSIVRGILKEDKFRLTFVMTKLMNSLLDGTDIKNPKILELGAATGFLTRWLLNRLGGTGTLVDKNKSSYEKYKSLPDNFSKSITYLNVDLFELKLQERFDIVCSFGLVEHFVDKQPVVAAHKKFVASNGWVIILIPLDSPLTRAFLEIHPELNLGYRELLSEREFKRMLSDNGLKIIRTEISQGYCYDFIGAVCCC